MSSTFNADVGNKNLFSQMSSEIKSLKEFINVLESEIISNMLSKLQEDEVRLKKCIDDVEIFHRDIFSLPTSEEKPDESINRSDIKRSKYSVTEPCDSEYEPESPMYVPSSSIIQNEHCEFLMSRSVPRSEEKPNDPINKFDINRSKYYVNEPESPVNDLSSSKIQKELGKFLSRLVSRSEGKPDDSINRSDIKLSKYSVTEPCDTEDEPESPVSDLPLVVQKELCKFLSRFVPGSEEKPDDSINRSGINMSKYSVNEPDSPVKELSSSKFQKKLCKFLSRLEPILEEKSDDSINRSGIERSKYSVTETCDSEYEPESPVNEPNSSIIQKEILKFLREFEIFCSSDNESDDSENFSDSEQGSSDAEEESGNVMDEQDVKNETINSEDDKLPEHVKDILNVLAEKEKEITELVLRLLYSFSTFQKGIQTAEESFPGRSNTAIKCLLQTLIESVFHLNKNLLSIYGKYSEIVHKISSKIVKFNKEY